MSEGTGAPPAADPGGASGGQPAGTPSTTTPPAGGQPSTPAAAAGNPLEDHADGLFDVKDNDPAWIRRLRTTGAQYRAQRNELAAKVAAYEKREAERTSQTIAQQRLTVAEAHGLVQVDEKGNKSLLPGIHLGDDPAKMEDIAKALSERLAPRSQGSSPAGRRPATITGKTSGTSADRSAGPNPAVEAVRAFMAGRSSSAP